ncbi:MAG TPA: TetR/AcrR family transcriptional regulator [Candidatus Binatia bacterium]|jgi:AcrR family transcriptional regulator
MPLQPKGSTKPPARGAATRAKIRDAANALFIRQGFEATTVDEIVAQAGVAKGTFYAHFDSKEELLLEYVSTRITRAEAQLPLLVAEPNFEAALARVVAISLRGKLWWNRDVARLAIETITARSADYEEVVRGLVKPLVEIGQARGQVRTDIAPEILARFIVRVLLGVVLDWTESGIGGTRDQALDSALVLVMSASRPAPG